MFNYFVGLGVSKDGSDLLKTVDSMKIYATFKDMFGELSTADLYLFTHYSPSQHHLKVWTSTKDAKVLLFIIL